MEVSGQLHTFAALTPQKSPEYKLKRASELVRAFWRRGEFLVTAMESDQNSLVIEPIA
jgi:hypothetical protein